MFVGTLSSNHHRFVCLILLTNLNFIYLFSSQLNHVASICFPSRQCLATTATTATTAIPTTTNEAIKTTITDDTIMELLGPESLSMLAAFVSVTLCFIRLIVFDNLSLFVRSFFSISLLVLCFVRFVLNRSTFTLPTRVTMEPRSPASTLAGALLFLSPPFVSVALTSLDVMSTVFVSEP